MVSRQVKLLAIFTLLLFCSTQYFAVDSAKTHEDDFRTKPNHNRRYIGSKITGKQVYVTPYYAPTGVQKFHALGFKGRGVKLGILDSGINRGAEAVKENYGHLHKYVENDKITKKLDSCNNRGMHLAGIAVAKTKYFTGIAPEATLGTYRVFGCKGPTSTSIVLQALTTAINDEMKIIVLPEIAIVNEDRFKLRETIEDAAKQGVIMIVAATINNFVNQQYFSYQNLPVLSVGGAKQKYRLSHWFEEKTTGRRIEFSSACSNMTYNFGKEMDIISNNPLDFLNKDFDGFGQGRIVLIQYDEAEMQALIKLAKATKVAALITVRDPFQKRRKCDVPLFNISEEDALFIKEGYRNKSGYKYIFAEKYGYIKDGSVTVDTAGPQNEPFMPPFYPDILAPSYKIYTTTIFSQANKPHFSDISAAVAYVADAVALLIEINDKSLINVKSIKDMLQNSAVPVKDINVDSYAIALYQGAGMLNLNRLIDIDAIRVSPSSINMGDTYANVVNIPIQISSLFSASTSYRLSHIPTAAIIRSEITSVMLSRPFVAATVLFPKSIETQPYQIAEITIQICTPTNILKDEIWSYSGYVVIDPNPGVNGSPSSRAVFIPYYGTVKG